MDPHNKTGDQNVLCISKIKPTFDAAPIPTSLLSTTLCIMSYTTDTVVKFRNVFSKFLENLIELWEK